MNDYQIDTTIQLLAKITEVATGELADPSTLTLYLNQPDGTTLTETYPAGAIVHDGVGLFHYDLTPAQSGEWNRQWQAEQPDGSGVTGPVASFWVQPSQFIAG